MRFRWESILGDWVSPQQQGFLHGRSMLQNVIDIETESMLAALRYESGGLVLFDFAAAFPSVSQTFLLRTLEHLGLPSFALSMVRALYDESACHLSQQGGLYPGFRLASGIRQGCPLSPLLYVTIADSLLRALCRQLPGSKIAAFADDTASVLPDLDTQLPVVHELFSTFAKISNLRLNLSKTIIIPLGDVNLQAYKTRLEQSSSPWALCSVAGWGRYLGFAVGPAAGDKSWDRPIQKFVQRVRDWNWSSLGLHGATLVYNILILPVLSFVAQLRAPSKAAVEAEAWALRRAAPGPGRWAVAADLWRLRSAFGLVSRFRSLQWTSMAAQARVFHLEAQAVGGLRIRRRCALLAAAERDTEFIVRRARMQQWLTTSSVRTLAAAVARLVDLGAGPLAAEQALSRSLPRPWPRHVALTVRRGLQRWMTGCLEQPSPRWPELRFRHKLARWHLAGFPRRVAATVLRRFRALRPLVAPRVHIATFGTLYNRWTTARRFQQSYEGTCWLGCGGDDSIEHYLRCSHGRAFARAQLGLDYSPSEMWGLLMLAELPSGAADTDDLWTRVALQHYVLYRTTHRLRHLPPPCLPLGEVWRALQQSLAEAVRGHPRSLQALRRLWQARAARSA